MADLRDRFRLLDQVVAPDLWSEVESRAWAGAPTMTIVTVPTWGSRRGERQPLALGPIVLIAMLVVIAIAGVILSAGAREHKIPPQSGPARNGVIVFGTADGDIVSVDPSTGSTRTLFSGSPNDSTVFGFSNDGRRFLYVRDGTWYVANVDGSDSRKLPEPQGFSYEWSPSGDRIVATAGDEDGPTTISIIDVENMTSTRLDLGIDGRTDATWRPNHDQLVLAEEKSLGTVVHLVDPDGSDLRPIEGMSPYSLGVRALSPDGSKMAYRPHNSVDDSTLHIVDLDSGLDRRLDPGWVAWQVASFSPDGTKLLLDRAAGPGTSELVIVPAAGAGPATAIGGRHRSMGGSIWADAVWSPDGKQILATYWEPTIDDYAPTTWLLDVASGVARQMPWVARNGMTWQPLAASTPVPLPRGIAVALASGTYRIGGGLGAPTVASLPALTLTVSDGWSAVNDSHDALEIYKEGAASISMMAFMEGEHVNVNADCGSGPLYSPGPVIDGTAESVIDFMRLGSETYGPVADVVFDGLPAKSLSATRNVPGVCGDGPSWAPDRATGQLTDTTLVVEVDGGVVLIGTSRWLDADPAVQRDIGAIIDSIRFESPTPNVRALATPR